MPNNLIPKGLSVKSRHDMAGHKSSKSIVIKRYKNIKIVSKNITKPVEILNSLLQNNLTRKTGPFLVHFSIPPCGNLGLTC
jgi:hypothetical protein